MSLTISHINNAKVFCQEYTVNNPELYVWDYCNFKVYPILNKNGNAPCNCRGFRLSKMQYEHLDESIFSGYTIEKLLERWYMLESMQYVSLYHCIVCFIYSYFYSISVGCSTERILCIKV